MNVYLLWRNNTEDYYVSIHDLIGVYGTRDKATAAYNAIAEPERKAKKRVPPLEGPGVPVTDDDSYEIEEAPVL